MTMETTSTPLLERATDSRPVMASELGTDAKLQKSYDFMRIRELEAELRSVRSATVCALCQMLDLKDLGTGLHSTRLAEWGVRLAGALGLDVESARSIEVAALLHDIGKVGIRDDVLRNPGVLSEDEMELMRNHPEYGWYVLRVFPELTEAALFILHHHERYDGTGYPAGLEADEIPLGARIVAVIDAFDAMISTRPYRKGLSFDEAVRRLVEGSGTQFDPVVVERFLQIAEAEWPMVMLSEAG
jgi:HD-GYP domain-containing protein (c-di-GMP phosphodiesterase class II)